MSYHGPLSSVDLCPLHLFIPSYNTEGKLEALGREMKFSPYWLKQKKIPILHLRGTRILFQDYDAGKKVVISPEIESISALAQRR